MHFICMQKIGNSIADYIMYTGTVQNEMVWYETQGFILRISPGTPHL